MTYSKIDIFSKVGDLLVEINDSYAALSEDGIANKAAELILLEAKTRYLAAHLAALQSLVPAQELAAVHSEAASTPAEAVAKPIASNPYIAPIIEQVEEAVEPEFKEPAAMPEINFAQIQQPLVEQAPVVDPKEEREEKLEESSIAAAAVETPAAETPAAETPAEETPAVETIVPETAAAVSTALASPAEAAPTPIAEVPEPEASPRIQETFVQQVIEAPKQIVIEEPVKESTPTAIPEEQAAPSRPLTLNEILQQQRKASTGTGYANTTQQASNPERIVDLKHAINLNDKLLFIKDLFNGYSLAYSEAVELLNRYATFAEADAFLQTNYALKNNWQDKNQTVEKLYVILRKKYM